MKNLNNTLKNKLNKKKGFTLAELLVVVAIIAILVAIAVPVFSSATDKAEKAVAQANCRSVLAEATVDYLGDDTLDTDKYTYDNKDYTVTVDEDEDTGEVTITVTGAGYTCNTDAPVPVEVSK